MCLLCYTVWIPVVEIWFCIWDFGFWCLGFGICGLEFMWVGTYCCLFGFGSVVLEGLFVVLGLRCYFGFYVGFRGWCVAIVVCLDWIEFCGGFANFIVWMSCLGLMVYVSGWNWLRVVCEGLWVIWVVWYVFV